MVDLQGLYAPFLPFSFDMVDFPLLNCSDVAPGGWTTYMFVLRFRFLLLHTIVTNSKILWIISTIVHCNHSHFYFEGHIVRNQVHYDGHIGHSQMCMLVVLGVKFVPHRLEIVFKSWIFEEPPPSPSTIWRFPRDRSGSKGRQN